MRTTEPFPFKRWAYVLAVAALIVVASSIGRVAGPKVTHFDKVTHFSVYGLLATLVVRAGGVGRWGRAVVAVSLFGASDEVHQYFTPGRSMEFLDWVADTLGALLAVTMYVRWEWYRERLEMPLRKRKPEPESPAALAVAETV